MIKTTSEINGKKVEHYDIIDSTQLEIHRRIKENKIEDGLIIITEKQTNGKEHMAEFGTLMKKIT